MAADDHRQGRSWPGYLLGGRLRTSTVLLVIAFCAMWWLYDTYQPPPGQVPANEVVPPGFIPDPAYTWAPRTDVQRRPAVTTTPPTTSTGPTSTGPGPDVPIPGAPTSPPELPPSPEPPPGPTPPSAPGVPNGPPPVSTPPTPIPPPAPSPTAPIPPAPGRSPVAPPSS